MWIQASSKHTLFCHPGFGTCCLFSKAYATKSPIVTIHRLFVQVTLTLSTKRAQYQMFMIKSTWDQRPENQTQFSGESTVVHELCVYCIYKEKENLITPFILLTNLILLLSLSIILKNLGIQYFSMRDIDRMGIQRVMEVTLDHLLARYSDITKTYMLI